MTLNIFEFPLEEEKLKSIIKEDKESQGVSYQRYPVRFVLLDSFSNFKKFVGAIHKNGAEIFDLTKLESFENFKEEDTWISRNELIEEIKRLPKDKDYIAVPVSEIIRFYNRDEFYSFLTSIMEIENDYESPKRRIYIPILGLLSRYQNDFLDKYHRNSEFIFTWKLSNYANDKYDLIFFKRPLKSENFTTINTTKDFLNLWKKENVSDKILISSNYLYSLSLDATNDEIFNIKRIANSKEYIEKFLNIRVPIDYKESEDEFWNKLLENIKDEKSFDGFVKRYLNYLSLEDFSKVNPLSLWLTHNNDFDRWILKAYYSTLNKDCYTRLVFNSMSNLNTEEAIKLYYLKIFDGKFDTEFLKERRNIIRRALKDTNIDLEFVENEFNTKTLSMKPEEIARYITGAAFFEKKWIIENLDKIKNIDIESIYPELSSYLEEINYDNLDSDNKWIIEYFDEYRISRIKNFPTKRLIEILDEKNANESTFFKWYYSFKPVKNYIAGANEYSKMWIDCLGVEFLPLLVSILKEAHYDVKFEIAAATLPSATEFNKFNEVDRISELDEFIHNQYSYAYPDNLIKEIEIITNIIDKAIKTKEKLLIFSDHGFTAFSNNKFEAKRILGITSAERGGRYAEVENEKLIPENEDFLIVNSDDGRKFLVATKYKFFSDSSYRESHGGATPEEILVPVIFASKVQKLTEKEQYTINLLKKEIDVRDPILEVQINPLPNEKIVWKVNDNKLNAVFDENKKVYKLNLHGYMPKEYILEVCIGNFIKELEFNIKGGLKEVDLL